LKTEGIDVSFINIDLAKPATIQAAAATIEAHYGRLDVLVNNAGIADRADGPPSKTSIIDAVRRIFDTNFFGTLAVTQAMCCRCCAIRLRGASSMCRAGLALSRTMATHHGSSRRPNSLGITARRRR